MKEYKTKNLRNIGIVGHNGSGKTTLTEALLYYTNTIDRFGKIEEENTISDYDIEEKKRKISINTTIEPCEWNDTKINFIDTPGYLDFIGEMVEGLEAADIALITVSGRSGIKIGTERAWNYVKRNNMPRAFFISKLDTENSNFEKVLKQLKNKFGISVVPIQFPIGNENNFIGVVNVISKSARIFNVKTKKIEIEEIPEELLDKIEECKNMIIEAVAETDETLMDKYFNEGTLSDEEIYNGLIQGCASGEIAPVMCGSAVKGIGINTMLEDIVECFPSPDRFENMKATLINENKDVNVKIDEDKKLTAQIFKTIADPFVGKLSLFKVITGKLKSDSIVYNINKQKEEKIGTMYFIRGKNQIPTDTIIAGDIGAVSKLLYSSTGDTLCDRTSEIMYKQIEFPNTSISMAVIAKAKGDEDKISSGLNKLLEEDPTFKVSRDIENAETIISGIGETHLDVIANKLKVKFGADVQLRFPKIPYRETIKKSVDVQGKHKKQSGGHGQYGDVVIKFEPRNDGKNEMLFVDNVVGGVVPRQYIPAVEKGLKECVNHGVLAGYPVIGLKAILHDGSYHPVDSSEMAFKVAASLAYKKGLETASPILLEPIMKVEVEVPDDYMGDVIGDLNKKRGKVLGMESLNGMQKIIAEVPQAEMFKYTTELKSITGARGSFVIYFERYEEVPENVAELIIEESKKE